MASTQNQVDRGCRQIAIWLGIIAVMFVVCVAIGVSLFALNLREHAGDAVHADLMQLIDAATLPDEEKIALRLRVDALVEAYQDERMTQEDFLAAVNPLREQLVAKQPAPPSTP